MILTLVKVIQLMDEVFLGGEVCETSKAVILDRMHQLDKDTREKEKNKEKKKAAKQDAKAPRQTHDEPDRGAKKKKKK